MKRYTLVTYSWYSWRRRNQSFKLNLFLKYKLNKFKNCINKCADKFSESKLNWVIFSLDEIAFKYSRSFLVKFSSGYKRDEATSILFPLSIPFFQAFVCSRPSPRFSPPPSRWTETYEAPPLIHSPILIRHSCTFIRSFIRLTLLCYTKIRAVCRDGTRLGTS